MRIIVDHHLDATLTIGAGASPDEAQSEITNTQNSVRGEVWRNVDTDPITVLGNFADGKTRPVNYFAIFRHRMHGANVRLELFSGANQSGSTLYDSTAVTTICWAAEATGYNWGAGLGTDPFLTEAPYWIWLPSTYDVLSYRISFSDHASTSTYWGAAADAWQASRFVLGSYLQPITGPSFGATFGWDAVHDSTRSIGGSLRTSQGSIWRTATLNLPALREEEVAFWRDLTRYVGFWNDFVVSVYDLDGTRRERDFTWLVKMASLDALGRQAKIWTKTLQLQEA